ncbi:MAG: nucleotidyltransferase domain-containing protein [Rhodoferax sp.]|nr:nucleotidyltransferase domain-containing protein [Rhodoferax sp.]
MTTRAFSPAQTTLIPNALNAFGDSLRFAVLIGSQANQTARPDSDWDIAVQWRHDLAFETVLALGERLRQVLANTLHTTPAKVDLIDLHRANLTMRAVAAEEGVPVWGNESIEWTHFLQRTWRDLEDFYWEKTRAA